MFFVLIVTPKSITESERKPQHSQLGEWNQYRSQHEKDFDPKPIQEALD